MTEEASKSERASAIFWAVVRGAVEDESAGIYPQVTLHYVQIEIKERVALAIKAIDELKLLDAQMNKLKGDQVQYDGAGVVVSQTFSKAKYEEKKKLEEKMETLEVALNMAFDKQPNFERLKRLYKDAKPEAAKPEGV